MIILFSFINVLVFNSAMASYKNSTTQVQQTSNIDTHTHTHTHIHTQTQRTNQQNIRFIADSAP
jgi:hypothetical protein